MHQLSIYVSIYISIHLSFYSYMYSSIHQYIHLFVYPPLHLSIHPSIHIYLPTIPTYMMYDCISLSHSLSLTLSLSIYIYIYIYIYTYIYTSFQMKYGLIEVMLLNKDLTVCALHLLISIDNHNNNTNTTSSSRSSSNSSGSADNSNNSSGSNDQQSNDFHQSHHQSHHHHSFKFGFEYRILSITRLLCTIISHLQIIHSSNSLYQPFLTHCSNIPALAPLMPGIHFHWSDMKRFIASLLSRNSGDVLYILYSISISIYL